MSKDKRLIIRIDEDRLGQFQRAAKREGKSVSEWLRDLGTREVAAPALEADKTKKWRLKMGFAAPEDCENPRCPVGCPDSHVLPSCDEDAIAMGVPTLDQVAAVSPPVEPLLHQRQVVWDANGITQLEPEPGYQFTKQQGRKTPAEVAASIPGLRVGFTKNELENGCEVGTGYVRVVDGEITFPANTPEEPVRSWVEDVSKWARLDEGEAHEELLRVTRGKWPPSNLSQWVRNPRIRPDLIAWLDEHYPLTDKEGW
jgi:hypothetical protein